VCDETVKIGHRGCDGGQSCNFTYLRRAGNSYQMLSMLALARSTRAAHILSLHARALSTIAHSASSPNTDAEQSGNDAAPAKKARTRRRQNGFANSSTECMIVYPWSNIRSSAEGLAIARAVQDKYGPAKDVVFSRVRFAQLASVIVTLLTPYPCTRRMWIVSTPFSHTFGSYMMVRT